MEMDPRQPQKSMSGGRSVELKPKSWQWRTLLAGTALALSVYYSHYAAEFAEGEAESSPVALIARLVAVLLLVFALRPVRLRIDSAFALTAMYCFALVSFLTAWAAEGATNDTFVFNTLLQLPVLLALSGTRLHIDYARWFRFIARLAVFQAAIDIAVVAAGSTLWISGAFVGGVGNPSSFGLICTLMCAFCLQHPQAGRGRRVLAVALAGAAVMTKSLFAVIALAAVAVIWASRSWRRLLASSVLATAASMSIYYFVLGAADNDDPTFIENKLHAAGALLGFVSYDVDSSLSVAGRIAIHQWTYEAVRDQPWQLLSGHFAGDVYWPMDSQILTYLGSFGIAMLLTFLLIHTLWTRRAFLNAKNDGGFSFVALLLFSFVFLTNRILDYFPVATVYFLCVMSSRQGLDDARTVREATTGADQREQAARG
jgi:hypothetical protein